jgi:hypothetical protein
MSAPPRFINNVYGVYPDDERVKDVFLQAAGQTYSGIGDRHVLLWWSNGIAGDGENVTQVVQLTGQAGNYSYYAPVAKVRSQNSTANNSQMLLGKFTRVQRDQLLNLAKNIKFEKQSTVNGCRVWTRDLLGAMVGAGLMSQEVFADVGTKVPLVARKAEAGSF